jgi:hypothetical protein
LRRSKRAFVSSCRSLCFIPPAVALRADFRPEVTICFAVPALTWRSHGSCVAGSSVFRSGVGSSSIGGASVKAVGSCPSD